MRVKIRRSPNPRKKFRATLEDGRFVDFGARGYSDYTKHKNPSRKKAYLLRHGAKKSESKMGNRRDRYRGVLESMVPLVRTDDQRCGATHV